MTGFYLMHRGWQDNPMFGREPHSRRDAWVWLIEHAAFKDTRVGVGGKSITISRGQLCYSLRYMAAAWGWDDAKVRRFLSRAETENMIACVADAGQTVITICNYDTYQASASVGDAQTDAASTRQRRSIDANKNEGKEVNQVKEEEPNGSLSSPSADDLALMVEKYNSTAKELGLSLVAKLEGSRRVKARARLAEAGMTGWEHALAKLRGEPCRWMRGDNDRTWRADFDFLITASKFTRLVEGAYDRVASNGHANGRTDGSGGIPPIQPIQPSGPRSPPPRYILPPQ